MAKTKIINSKEDFSKVAEMLETFTSESDFPVAVTVRKYIDTVKSRQRGLYWRWLEPICKHTGYTKEEFHERMKETIFINTYISDPDNHPEFIGVVELMETIKNGVSSEMYKQNRDLVMSSVSHKDASPENWRVILPHIEGIANKLNVKLPAPTDREDVYV